MGVIKRLILNKINLLIGSIITLCGIGATTTITSCDNQYAHIEPDSMMIDTMAHCMYGVTPVIWQKTDSIGNE